MSRERVVVIGADGAGMSAAHQALRVAADHGRDIDVLAFEATEHTSYSACGIPYWIAGDVGSSDDLVARSAAEHRDRGVDLRMGVAVTALDLARAVVTTDDGGTHAFDQLVIATGAGPIVPDWARGSDGGLLRGVGPVKDLDDGAAWLDRFVSAGEGAEVVIAGGGYIGLEMAESALRRGLSVTLLTRSRVMHGLDPELGERIVAALEESGVRVVERSTVVGLGTDEGRVVEVTTEDGRCYPCDLLVLALGVEPRTGIAADAGLPVGDHGALCVDERGLVVPGIWAAGDCCETRHRLTGEAVFLPLGTHANKMGRAVGTNLGGGSARFEGVLGTAITRFADGQRSLEVARTGLSEEEARAAGFDVLGLITEGTTASGYMPEAEPIAVKVVAERGTRRLLGVQIVGGPGAGKRIDTAVVALWAEQTVDDVAAMDLSYAPPFSTTWEIVQIAVRRVADRL